MALALKRLAAGLAMTILCSPVGALAQQGNCFPMPLVEKMASDHKEAPVSFGRTEGGWTLTIWASENGKTWTAVMVSPDGKIGCVIPGVHGADWVPGELSGKGV